DRASRHVAAAAIGSLDVAGPALLVGVVNEFVARGDAAGPALAGVVEAKLVDRGRIDAAQANARAADHDLIALADLRHPADVGGLGHDRHQNDRDPEQAFHQHAK